MVNQLAQLDSVLLWYTKVAGSIPYQGTYKNQPLNAWVKQQISLSLSLSLSQVNKYKFKKILPITDRL